MKVDNLSTINGSDPEFKREEISLIAHNFETLIRKSVSGFSEISSTCQVMMNLVTRCCIILKKGGIAPPIPVMKTYFLIC